MKKRYRTEVHEKGTQYGKPGLLLATVYRVLYTEMIGNFNPIFCRYKGKKHLVQSLAGDLSDPFRRQENYLDSLFIEVDK